MIRIALVGDIGCGKSYFSKLFGYPIFNADAVVAEIYKKNKKSYIQIKKKLPNYFSKFPIKKDELIKCILAERSNLKKITKIVHPLVRKQMEYFIRKNKGKKFVILDIPLFLENKLNMKNDVIIYIQSSKDNIIKRLSKRNYYNKKLIKRFKEIQLPLKIKKKMSNLIIKNDFNGKKASNDVQNILKEIL